MSAEAFQLRKLKRKLWKRYTVCLKLIVITPPLKMIVTDLEVTLTRNLRCQDEANLQLVTNNNSKDSLALCK